MSGTSLDGMDLVLARFALEEGVVRWEILRQASSPWPCPLREQLLALASGEPRPAADFSRLHFEIARAFAAFVAEALDGDRAELAAFPGQTIHHDPAGGHGLQLGSPAVFAQLTGLRSVGDFRGPDLALGGQGAPLVPLADALLRRSPDEHRVLLNLGGIANLTLLPPGWGVEGVRAWDLGPGNILLDLASRALLDEPFDRDGRRAAAGRPRSELLESWLAHPWFAQAPPKSTGRELFGTEFLPAAELEALALETGVEDLLATLAELTVEPVARALAGGRTERLVVAGGGAENSHLMSRLAERLAPLPVESVAALGVPPQYKEALDFALLAWLAEAGHPVSLPPVTGASRPAPAGIVAPAGPPRSKE